MTKCENGGRQEPTQTDRLRFEVQYPHYIEDIRFCKTQQWLVAYYAFLLQAGIIFIFKEISGYGWARTLCTIASWIVAVAAIAVMSIYLIDTNEYRKKKEEILKPFHVEKSNGLRGIILVGIFVLFILLAAAATTVFITHYWQ